MALESSATAGDQIEFVNIRAIHIGGGTQNRALNPSTVHQYSALMREQVEFPPIRLWFDGEVYWVADGFHRLEATKAIGITVIKASIFKGTIEDAIWDSFSANSRHGLKRTATEIRAILARTFQHTHSKNLSNVEIGRHLGVPEATVRRWRHRLSSSNDDDGSRVVHRNGTTYTLHPKHTRTPPIVKAKPYRQLRSELAEMQNSCGPDLAGLLEIVASWIEGDSPIECLLKLQSLQTHMPECDHAPCNQHKTP
jgi:hypothetical protein